LHYTTQCGCLFAKLTKLFDAAIAFNVTKLHILLHPIVGVRKFDLGFNYHKLCTTHPRLAKLTKLLDVATAFNVAKLRIRVNPIPWGGKFDMGFTYNKLLGKS
jgi:hypothetical protein